MGKIKHTDASKCINCHLCTKHCSFLTKYGITIGDVDRLRELKYSCFLCGECTRVCPKDIDGRQIILDMRTDEVKEGRYGLKQKGYGALLFEKKNYIFKNYRKGKSKSLLFPGCNFPSYFPKTIAYLSKLLKDVADIDTVYDCCGKPIAELGLVKEENKIIDRINDYIKRHGIEELILLCPNCYYHFGDRLNVKITVIYEKLAELGLGNKIDVNADIFLPCPDRENKKWMEYLKPFIGENTNFVKDVQCCGMGGCAMVKERELSDDMPKKLKEQGHEGLISYCGTCAGTLSGRGCSMDHFLPMILGTGEKADYKNSWTNRAKTKFK